MDLDAERLVGLKDEHRQHRSAVEVTGCWHPLKLQVALPPMFEQRPSFILRDGPSCGEDSFMWRRFLHVEKIPSCGKETFIS